MPSIRLVAVADRLAQQRLGEAYGLLVPERAWSTRGTPHEHGGTGIRAGNGRGVSARVEPDAARPRDDRESA